MKEIAKHLKVIVVLILIQFLLDMLYVYIYPTVNPIRATLIGFSALVILYSISLIPFVKNLIDLKPYIAFLPIYSSAFFGALLVQAGIVASKSAASGIAHIVILIVTYAVIVIYMNKKLIALSCIFLIFIISCQTTQTSDKKETASDKDMKQTAQPQEKMAAMNVITYDSDRVTVVIDELAFLPAFIHIKKETKVTWENRDKVEHTVAWHNRKTPTKVTESDVLESGNKYTYTFNEEGVYDYICGIHPFMHGGIIVGNPPELAEMMEFAEDTAPPKVFSINPNKISVNGGDKVTVKGENFVKDTTVFFHHLFGDVKFIDSKTLEVITPKHYSLKMDVIITNPDGDHFSLPNSFEFFGEEEQQVETTKFEFQEKRTPHFTSSTPKHGDTVSSASIVSVSFNFPIVKGSNIILYDSANKKLAEGTLTSDRLGLEIKSVSNFNPGTYKVTYHAIWLGGSAHDGEFYFKVIKTQEQSTKKTYEEFVDIADFKFTPVKLSIKKGTKVIWTNKDKAPHTVTADNINIGPNSEVLKQNEIYSYIFDKVGTFTYYCKIHPSMRATVEVIE